MIAKKCIKNIRLRSENIYKYIINAKHDDVNVAINKDINVNSLSDI